MDIQGIVYCNQHDKEFSSYLDWEKHLREFHADFNIEMRPDEAV